jgi:hypothetical protein
VTGCGALTSGGKPANPGDQHKKFAVCKVCAKGVRALLDMLVQIVKKRLHAHFDAGRRWDSHNRSSSSGSSSSGCLLHATRYAARATGLPAAVHECAVLVRQTELQLSCSSSRSRSHAAGQEPAWAAAVSLPKHVCKHNSWSTAVADLQR